MHDLALDALHVSLRGLSARQRTLNDNIANVETPRFMAGRVDFEDSLRSATGEGAAWDTEISSRFSLDATNPNGNNVNLAKESVMLAETELRYQLAVNGVNSKFRLLRTAIGQ